MPPVSVPPGLLSFVSLLLVAFPFFPLPFLVRFEREDVRCVPLLGLVGGTVRGLSGSFACEHGNYNTHVIAHAHMEAPAQHGVSG